MIFLYFIYFKWDFFLKTALFWHFSSIPSIGVPLFEFRRLGEGNFRLLVTCNVQVTLYFCIYHSLSFWGFKEHAEIFFHLKIINFKYIKYLNNNLQMYLIGQICTSMIFSSLQLSIFLWEKNRLQNISHPYLPRLLIQLSASPSWGVCRMVCAVPPSAKKNRSGALKPKAAKVLFALPWAGPPQLQR